MDHKQIGVAVIWNPQGKILIDRRKPQDTMGGLWEFPGGKIEPGETVVQCIKREIQEELGIDIEVGEHCVTITHKYANYQVTLIAHHCRHAGGEPQTIECDEILWVTLPELDHFCFPEANIKLIEALQNFKKS